MPLGFGIDNLAALVSSRMRSKGDVMSLYMNWLLTARIQLLMDLRQHFGSPFLFCRTS